MIYNDQFKLFVTYTHKKKVKILKFIFKIINFNLKNHDIILYIKRSLKPFDFFV